MEGDVTLACTKMCCSSRRRKIRRRRRRRGKGKPLSMMGMLTRSRAAIMKVSSCLIVEVDYNNVEAVSSSARIQALTA